MNDIMYETTFLKQFGMLPTQAIDEIDRLGKEIKKLKDVIDEVSDKAYDLMCLKLEAENTCRELQQELNGYLYHNHEKGWHPIEFTPNDGRMCLFYIPEKDYPVMNRCDDYWAGAYWLQNATHYMLVTTPERQSSRGFSYNPGMGKSVLKAQAEKIEKLETDVNCALDKLSISVKFIPKNKKLEYFSELVTINAKYYGNSGTKSIKAWMEN